MSRRATSRPASPAKVRVRLLGPAEITGTRQPLQPKQAELVYALSLRTPPGLSSSALATMLGPDPDHAKPPDGLRQLITRTRRRMGAVPGGGEYIGFRDGRYFMTGAWRDWDAFAALAARGRATGSRAALRAALGLVRGQPCDGAFYWWLDPVQVEAMRAEVTDTAGLLAGLELAGGDPAAAGRAARSGLAADPAAEHLWRAVMRAEDAAGNSACVHQAWRLLLAAIADITDEGTAHPVTAALYRELSGTRARSAR